MKTLRYLFCAAAVIAAFSCNKEMQEPEVVPEKNETELIPLTFTATTPDTRTTLDGMSINWLSTDKISVFDGQSVNNCFETTSSGKTVQFSGTVTQTTENYLALYPYNAAATCTGISVKTTLPAAQTLVKGTFADGLNINAATSADNTTFSFKNVLSVAKFTLDATKLGNKTIKTVKFSSDAPLAGDVSILYSNEGITASAGNNTFDEITMQNADGTGLEDGTYYFVVLPNTSRDITMTFEATDGSSASISATLNSDFVANTIKNLGTVQGLTWDVLQSETDFKLVTSTDGLPSVGDIIIVNGSNAMSEDRGNNRAAADVPDAVNNVITLDNTSTAHVFTLKHTASGYLISDKVDGKYLFAAATSNNYLKSKTTLGDDCYWNLVYTNGNLEISSVNNTARGVMRFNSSNNPPIFSCYAANNTQAAVSIYLNEDSVVKELAQPVITTAVDGSTITVTWEDVPNATSYLVTCTNQENLTIDPGVQSASFANLADGFYEVSVIAKTTVSGYIDSVPAVASSIRIGTPTLSAPTNVFVEQAGSGIFASWTASPDATSYDWTLYDNEGLTSIVANGNVESTSLTANVTLTAGTTYFFTVQAKANGYNPSPVSSVESFTAISLLYKVFTANDYYTNHSTLTLTKNPITGAFAKGGGTSAPAINETRVRLYQPQSGTKGGTLTITSTAYNIMRVEFTFVSGQKYLASDSGTYEDTGDNSAIWTTSTAVNSVEFYCNGSSNEFRADIASFTVYYVSNGPEQLAMGTISCIDSGVNESSLTFNWDSITEANGYQVSEDGTTFGSTQSENTYTLSGLQPGTSHTIWVKAIGDGTTYLTSAAKESESGTTKISGDDNPAYVLSSAISGGKYILVNPYSNKNYICSGVVSNKSLTVTDASSLIVNDRIASTTTTDAYAVTIEETTNGYTIKNSAGNYLGANKGDLSTSNTPTTWTIIKYSDNSWIFSCIGGRALFIGASGNSCKNYSTSNLNTTGYSSTYMILYKYNK